MVIIVAFVVFGFVVSLNFEFVFSLGEKFVVPTIPCSIINVAHVSLLGIILSMVFGPNGQVANIGCNVMSCIVRQVSVNYLSKH